MSTFSVGETGSWTYHTSGIMLFTLDVYVGQLSDSPTLLTSNAKPRVLQSSVGYVNYSAVQRLAWHLDKWPAREVKASPDEFVHKLLSFALHVAFADEQDALQSGKMCTVPVHNCILDEQQLMAKKETQYTVM